MSAASIQHRVGSSAGLGLLGILVATGLLVLTTKMEIVRDVWYTAGAVYLLMIAGVSGLWWLRGRRFRWSYALGVATLSVLLLIPLTSRLFIQWGQTDPTLARYLLVVLPLHLQRVVPIAFLLPLGTAQTDRERFATLGVIVFPAVYEVIDWFVFHPERFDPLWTTPFRLVVGTAFWFGVSVAFGSVLFVLGCRLGNADST